jgi:DNA recombination protein RmuC
MALNEDTTLYNKAFEKICNCNPCYPASHIKNNWQHRANQKQQENAFEIARQAGALYDKFEGFVADLIKIERKSTKLKRNIGLWINWWKEKETQVWKN